MEKIVPFEKGSICYDIEGSGPAVILLHGFLEDKSIWSTCKGKLSNKFTVVTIDLPGFGKSSIFNEEHTMAFMANAVYYVLIEENIDQCVMLGHSMGGYVSLAFADLYPDRLKGLVLFHSQVGADDKEAKSNRDRTIRLIRNDKLGFINSFIPELFAKTNRPKYEDTIENLKKSANKVAPEAVIAALVGMRDRNDYRNLLARLEIPVLFIIGKQDSRIPLETSLSQLGLPANCEAVILDNVGHMGFIEAEKMAFAAVEHFVERNA